MHSVTLRDAELRIYGVLEDFRCPFAIITHAITSVVADSYGDDDAVRWGVTGARSANRRYCVMCAVWKLRQNCANPVINISGDSWWP